MKPERIETFRTRSAALRRGVEEPPVSASQRHYLQLSLDTFETLEDWRHDAILELMKIHGFQPDIRRLARTLKITVSEARAYVERLLRVGLLEISAEGRWVDRSEGFSTHILGENETSYAHRRSQKRILEGAIEALDGVPIECRDQSSMMMATHSSKIAEAKRRIARFRRELCEFLEDCEIKDAVYQVSVSLFPWVQPVHVSPPQGEIRTNQKRRMKNESRK